MVAREVRVNAMGVRTGGNGGPGERFTEEASSVLIHENGGVIQLSTAVARGQLLLLINVELNREVVAQVKRTYQPMNRCVELEFAEPAPRFWGMEFSAATALLPKDAKYVEATALISAGAADEPGEALPAPTAEEVQAFRRAMNALDKEAPSAPAATKSVEIEQDPAQRQVTTADQLPVAEQEELPKPSFDFAMPLPKPKLFRARGNFTPGALPRLAIFTTALVITVLGTAWFKHGIPWRAGRKPSAGVPVVGADVSTSLPPKSRDTARVHSESTKLTDTNAIIDASAPLAVAPPAVSESPAQHAASKASPLDAGIVARKAPRPTALALKREMPRPTTPTITTPESVASPVDGVIIPPKLIKSVQAVASLDAVRDFETGNVVIDAVVGTEGEVHFITVISGPPSLRAPAVEAAKQYRYEPATRNGQPVPEHVRITIRFRFES